MATEVSNIDDLLLGGTSPSVPAAPESNYSDTDDTPDLPEYGNGEEDDHTEEPQTESDSVDYQEDDHTEEEAKEPEKKEPEYDDYGNTKAPPRTYTEEEVNERINKAVRERLARGNNQNQQPTQQQVAQQAQDFQYDPDAAESWESQLEQFVEKTVSKIGQKQAQQQQRERDAAQQQAFEDKFTRGMDRFSDFREVVGAQPVTDPMTYALRGLADPAAFIYAASKRHPQELSRISQIADPVAQIMEMGRLEERMRKTAPGTKAPRPVSKSREDTGMPTQPKRKEPTIEDLIAKSDAKRRQQLERKRGR